MLAIEDVISEKLVLKIVKSVLITYNDNNNHKNSAIVANIGLGFFFLCFFQQQ